MQSFFFLFFLIYCSFFSRGDVVSSLGLAWISFVVAFSLCLARSAASGLRVTFHSLPPGTDVRRKSTASIHSEALDGHVFYQHLSKNSL